MNKKKIIRIIIEILIFSIVVLGIYVANLFIKNKRIEEFYQTEDGCGYTYQIEDVWVDEYYLNIKGWFIELEKVRNAPVEIRKDAQLCVLLYNCNDDFEYDMDGNLLPCKGLVTSLEHSERDDINRYFDCEYDYSDCGFVAKIKKSKVDLTDGDYQLIFKIDEEDYYGILSGTYITNGSLNYIRQEKKIPLDIDNTDLEPIVKDGMIIASSPENTLTSYSL